MEQGGAVGVHTRNPTPLRVALIGETMADLHVFDVYGGEEELVIAAGAEDARALCAENVSADELAKATFEQYPDDWPLPFREEEDRPSVTKTCGEWAQKYGRGHFATTYT